MREQRGEVEEGLADTFRGKVISVRSMEGRLLGRDRIIVAAAVVIALRDLPRPAVGAGFLNPWATVPLPVVVMTTDDGSPRALE